MRSTNPEKLLKCRDILKMLCKNDLAIYPSLCIKI